MTKNIISQEYQRSQRLNELLQKLHSEFKDIYTSDVKKLVYLCYELGATQEQVAKALGTERTTIANKYPKKVVI